MFEVLKLMHMRVRYHRCHKTRVKQKRIYENNGSVYPIAYDDSWKKHLTLSTVISDAKVSK